MDVERKCQSCGRSFPNTAEFWYKAGIGHTTLIHRKCPTRVASILRTRQAKKSPNSVTLLSQAAKILGEDLEAMLARLVSEELQRRHVDLVVEDCYRQVTGLLEPLTREQRNAVVEKLIR